MSTVHVVVGGQFGSEAKGAVGAWLARTKPVQAAIRVAGPNAGHSAFDAQGRKWALRQIPVAAVADLDCDVVIGAGSEIDAQVLRHEITQLEEAGIPIYQRLYIDRTATLLEPRHIEEETGEPGRIGSTGKGVGASRADRVWRKARLWGDALPLGPDFSDDTVAHIREVLENGSDVMLEGTQGYGLGLHAGFYPYCTSSDCRAIDFLAMAGISPWMETSRTLTWSADGYGSAAESVDIQVWVTYRTYPIRVAGNSGPLLYEQDWADLAERTNGYIQPERTTVTQKIRRIGRWDPTLARAAYLANGGPSPNVHPVLTFLDYDFPELANETNPLALTAQHWEYLDKLAVTIGSNFTAVGTGPNAMMEV